MTLNPLPAKSAAAKAYNAFNLVGFVVGSKNTNTIVVSVQLKDARGQSVAQVCKFKMYLSANADGSTVTGTATSSALAAGTNGKLLGIETTGKVADYITDASGRCDVSLVQTAGGTNYYLVVCLPDGGVAVSSLVSF